jgi:TM2 domain-containing membrane protein YozV
MATKQEISGKQIAIGAVSALVGMGLFNLVKGTAFEGVLMWVVGLIILGFIAFVIWILSSNKGIKKASAEETQKARLFQPEPGQGVIYVLRSQYAGLLMGLEVRLDGKAIGQTRGYSFYRLIVAPGAHELSGTERCPEALQVNVGAGQIAFVEQFLRNDSSVPRYGYQWSSDIASVQQKILKTKMYLPTE